MNANLFQGFEYTLELCDPNGVVVERETIHNIMPTEGQNHALSVLLAGGTQNPTWYIGLFEGNYTPTLTDTAAAFPAASTETTTYSEATRVAFVPGAISGGAATNSASRAEFTSTSSKTIYGAFMVSASGKGATSGVLLSAAKFSTTKSFDVGFVLRVTAGITASSS